MLSQICMDIKALYWLVNLEFCCYTYFIKDGVNPFSKEIHRFGCGHIFPVCDVTCIHESSYKQYTAASYLTAKGNGQDCIYKSDACIKLFKSHMCVCVEVCVAEFSCTRPDNFISNTKSLVSGKMQLMPYSYNWNIRFILSRYICVQIQRYHYVSLICIASNISHLTHESHVLLIPNT